MFSTVTTLPVKVNRFSRNMSEYRQLSGTSAQMALLEMLGREHIPCRYEEFVPREGEYDSRGFPKHYSIDVLVLPKLAIEVDGTVHGRTLRLDSKDAKKQLYLESHGYRVLRFTNREVIFEAEKVLNAIRAEMH